MLKPIGRLARGSIPPQKFRATMIELAVRSRFPKLAVALGDRTFETMLAAYFQREPEARTSVRESGARLAGFLAASPEYPLWYAELAALDRAHVEVLHAPVTAPLARRDLTHERALRLAPACTLVDLTTACDELWTSLDALPAGTGTWNRTPRELEWPRTVMVWRHGPHLRERTVSPDETCALRAAQRGTTLVELHGFFGGASPHGRALDTVLEWIDAGVLLR